MKKLFVSIALLATACLGVFAEEGDGYRRTWDFTKGWSAETVALLEADAATWEVQSTGFQNIVALTANETPWVIVNGEKQPIAELVGMTINSNNAKAKHSQICTTGSGLAGVSCYWLNGKGDAVSVKVPAGENVRFGYTAHGATDRGFACNTGFADANGATKWTNADNQEIHEVELINSNEAEATLTLTTQNGGCHIYYIIIGEGDSEPEYEPTDITVAYIYDGTYNGAKDADKNPMGWLKNGGLDSDPVYSVLQSFNATAIDLNGQTLTTQELNDSLLNFDVVVLGEALSSGNAFGKAMFDIVNKVPMLNLKSFMYKKGVWGVGAGSNPSPKATSVKVNEAYLENALFADLNIGEEGSLVLFDCEDVSTLAGGNLVQGYTVSAGSLFENDEVIATVGDGINAIHTHGTKNQYMLIPISSDNMDLLSEDASMLIYNAVTVLAQTKSKVQNAAQPVITQVASNGSTNVSIACATAGSTIYFTTDGTDPTEASPVYAEAFDVTTDSLVVKAFATAHGYNPSNIATAIVVVKAMASAPQITCEYAEGFTTITLSGDEGDNLYFSFNGLTTVAGSHLYAEPVIIREPATITALAASNTKLASETVTENIPVQGIPAVKDTVAHFTANENDWFTNIEIKDYEMNVQELPTSNFAAKAAYYWGKSAWAYYSTEVDHTEAVVDSLGNPVLDINGVDSVKIYYKPDPTAVKYVYSTVDTQWRLRSQGQVLTGETNVAPLYAVSDAGEANYYAETPQDLIGQPTKGKLTFGGKGSGEPYTASVESTVKFTAPFDVVTYMTKGGDSDVGVVVQTSADGETWVTADTLTNAATQRYYKKDRIHIDAAAGEVYVRLAHTFGSTKGQIYDIYVITTEGTTGIEAIESDEAPLHNLTFDLEGRQVTAPTRGHLFIQNGKKLILK